MFDFYTSSHHPSVHECVCACVLGWRQLTVNFLFRINWMKTMLHLFHRFSFGKSGPAWDNQRKEGLLIDESSSSDCCRYIVDC